MADGCLLVTGGSGLTGSNIALAARKKGQRVRVLVRSTDGLDPLTDAGIEIAKGDVTDPDSLDRALRGVSEVVHTAAVLGGTWSTHTADDFWAVNHQGTLNVLDAAKKANVSRTVTLDTAGILDFAFTLTERSPIVLINPIDSPYIRAKRAAYYGGLHRAALGQDIRFVTPGGIYGPGPFVKRALDPTSFTALALRGIRGELDSYVKFPLPWTYVHDLVEITLRAVEKGEPGRRYLAVGGNEDVMSVAAFCNLSAELAGSPHRVREIDPHAPDCPDIGTMRQFAVRKVASPLIDCSQTTGALGYAPTPIREALGQTVAWLRDVREVAAKD